MKEMLNGDTLFNTLAMVRLESATLMLVVEGDDDHFLLRSHLAPSVSLINGGGRPSVLRAADLTEARGLDRVAFVIDAEYDSFVGNASYSRDVVVSRNHDLTMDLVAVSTATIDRVIASHSRGVERSGRAAVDPAAVRGEAMALAAQVALLRVVNDRDRLSLRLDDFPFGVLSSARPSLQEIAEVAVGRSRPNLDVEDLAARMSVVEEDPLATALPGDHDFFGAVARVLSERGVRNCSAKAIVSSYLAAVSCGILDATEWFQDVVHWAAGYGVQAFGCPCAA